MTQTMEYLQDKSGGRETQAKHGGESLPEKRVVLRIVFSMRLDPRIVISERNLDEVMRDSNSD